MSNPVTDLIALEDAPTLVEHEGEEPGEGPAIACPPGSGEAQWLAGAECRVLARPRRNGHVGEVFARFSTSDGEAFSCRAQDARVTLPFSITEAYRAYVTEGWVPQTAHRSLSAGQLDVYYRIKRLIPRSAQLALRRLLIRWQRAPSFPRWPYDDSVERLARFYAGCALLATGTDDGRLRWFWPNGAQAASILTHDVEGPAGLRNALRVAELEESRGFRSSFNIVADWYPIDWGIVEELRARGHEIGSHALYHDRSLFSSRAEFERQLPLLSDAVRRLGAVGFRSPATHRVPDWIGELPVDYDGTMSLSDPYEPQPGGTCSQWPFMLGDVVELPYTLPQDHTLFTLLQQRSADLWIAQMRRVKQSFGLVHCLSHPDPGYLGEPRNERIYADFLDALRAEDGIWHALPCTVAAWWRARAAGHSLDSLQLCYGIVSRGRGSVLADLTPPQDADAH